MLLEMMQVGRILHVMLLYVSNQWVIKYLSCPAGKILLVMMQGQDTTCGATLGFNQNVEIPVWRPCWETNAAGDDAVVRILHAMLLFVP